MVFLDSSSTSDELEKNLKKVLDDQNKTTSRPRRIARCGKKYTINGLAKDNEAPAKVHGRIALCTHYVLEQAYWGVPL